LKCCVKLGTLREKEKYEDDKQYLGTNCTAILHGKEIDGHCRYTTLCKKANFHVVEKSSCGTNDENIKCCIDPGNRDGNAEKSNGGNIFEKFVSAVVPDYFEKFWNNAGKALRNIFTDEELEEARKRVNRMPRSTVTAYRNGNPFTVMVVAAQGEIMLDMPAAVAFEKMRATALEEVKIKLYLIQGFRSKEEQDRRFGDRTVPKDHLALQTGRAAWFSFKTNEIKQWIEENSKTYGFCRTIESNDRHYEFRPDHKGCL
jgi:hypothetical protein